MTYYRLILMSPICFFLQPAGTCLMTLHVGLPLIIILLEKSVCNTFSLIISDCRFFRSESGLSSFQRMIPGATQW